MRSGRIINKLTLFVYSLVFLCCCSDRKRVEASETISHGEAFFLNECARCHGDRGEGKQEEDVPRLRNGDYTFEEVKDQMLYPEDPMPEFENVPDSVIQQIVIYINMN